MKRKLKWLAIVLAVSLLGFGTALLLWPRDRITAESWQKIRIGMTEDEVAEILGGPGVSWEQELAQKVRLEKELGPFEIQLPALEEPVRKGFSRVEVLDIRSEYGPAGAEGSRLNWIKTTAFAGKPSTECVGSTEIFSIACAIGLAGKDYFGNNRPISASACGLAFGESLSERGDHRNWGPAFGA